MKQEAKETCDEFFPKCGLSEEQIKRIKAALSELAEEEGTIYDLDEIITDSPTKWMEQHDTVS
jgi:hypothetical protein